MASAHDEKERTSQAAVLKRMRSNNPSKKIRLMEDETTDNTPCQPSHLFRIPFEILAEILLHTTSPKDLLSVARCSKFLCNTLVQNETSSFIWRRVRAGYKPAPIPDPTPNFTEPSYAAFLFDGGNCEVCNKFVNKPYYSFALRVRLCGKSQCSHALKKNFTAGDGRVLRMPSLESSSCLFSDRNSQYWPTIKRYHRLEEWDRAIAELSEATFTPEEWNAYWVRNDLKMQKWTSVMSFSVAVHKWTRHCHAYYKKVQAKNEEFAHRIATSEGWNKQDLLMSNSYGQLHQYRSKLFEEVKLSDYDFIRPEVDAQILNIIERRNRQAEEKILRKRRSEVEAHFHRLRSNGKTEPLPTLVVFRELPVIKFVQTRASKQSATAELKSSLVSDLLRDDLDKWRKSVKATLAAILGYANWKSSSTKKLHPADRVTARFKCKKCSMVARKYCKDECLDFAGVCSHRCLESSGRSKAKEDWQAEQFIPDRKAISAISKVLKLCNVDPEVKESLEAVKNIGTRIMCLSCDSAIIMGFESLVGHSQRHDNMEVSLLSDPEMSILAYPISYGLSAKLMRHSLETKLLCSLKEYSCRHCIQLKPLATALAEKTAGPGQKEGADDSTVPTLYTFDGLRSHCKQKHGIMLPQDEDFFQINTETKEHTKGNDRDEAIRSER